MGGGGQVTLCAFSTSPYFLTFTASLRARAFVLFSAQLLNYKFALACSDLLAFNINTNNRHLEFLPLMTTSIYCALVLVRMCLIFYLHTIYSSFISFISFIL
jgi:hypothetical protein